MMAYTLNANEEYEEALQYYRLAISALEQMQDTARAGRNRLGLLVALSMMRRHEEAIESGLAAQAAVLDSGDHEGHARAYA